MKFMMLHSCINRVSNYIKYIQQLLYLETDNLLHKINYIKLISWLIKLKIFSVIHKVRDLAVIYLI